MRLEEQAMLKRERAHVSARDALKRAIVCGAGQPPCRGALLLPEPEVRRGRISEELGAERTEQSPHQKKKKARVGRNAEELGAEATVTSTQKQYKNSPQTKKGEARKDWRLGSRGNSRSRRASAHMLTYADVC